MLVIHIYTLNKAHLVFYTIHTTTKPYIIVGKPSHYVNEVNIITITVDNNNNH